MCAHLSSRVRSRTRKIPQDAKSGPVWPEGTASDVHSEPTRISGASDHLGATSALPCPLGCSLSQGDGHIAEQSVQTDRHVPTQCDLRLVVQTSGLEVDPTRNFAASHGIIGAAAYTGPRHSGQGGHQLDPALAGQGHRQRGDHCGAGLEQQRECRHHGARHHRRECGNPRPAQRNMQRRPTACFPRSCRRSATDLRWPPSADAAHKGAGRAPAASSVSSSSSGSSYYSEVNDTTDDEKPQAPLAAEPPPGNFAGPYPRRSSPRRGTQMDVDDDGPRRRRREQNDRPRAHRYRIQFLQVVGNVKFNRFALEKALREHIASSTASQFVLETSLERDDLKKIINRSVGGRLHIYTNKNTVYIRGPAQPAPGIFHALDEGTAASRLRHESCGQKSRYRPHARSLGGRSPEAAGEVLEWSADSPKCCSPLVGVASVPRSREGRADRGRPSQCAPEAARHEDGRHDYGQFCTAAIGRPRHASAIKAHASHERHVGEHVSAVGDGSARAVHSHCLVVGQAKPPGVRVAPDLIGSTCQDVKQSSCARIKADRSWRKAS